MFLQRPEMMECPWPLPPSAILLRLPIPEDPGVATSERQLRKLIRYSKSPLKSSSPWQFENGPRPLYTCVKLLAMHIHLCVCVYVLYKCDVCVCRYYDDGTPATNKNAADRHYCVRQDHKETISVVEWARFLSLWSVADLDAAARLVRVSSVHDLDEAERELLQTLRETYSHLLFLKSDDPLSLYQKQLKRLHDLGILNLHTTSVVFDTRSQ